jgi:hypothetical protein
MAARTFCVALVVVVWPLLAVPAAARTSIGANTGFTMLSGGGDLVIAAPATTSPFHAGVVPGLRIGLMEQARTAPVIETSLAVLASSRVLAMLHVAAHVRHHLGHRPDEGPYVTAGMGVVFEEERASRQTFGIGLGASRPVSDDHGRVRIELRYDYVPEEQRNQYGGYPAIHAVSFKVGFDLLSSTAASLGP